MKTPRELLLDRHRAAQSKLDSIRRDVLAPAEKHQRECRAISLWDVLRSCRWHLAGMSAIWVFILFLRLDTGRSPKITASIPPAKISRQFIMASMRENRRQLSEMIGTQPAENEPRELFLPKPRSERRCEMLTA